MSVQAVARVYETRAYQGDLRHALVLLADGSGEGGRFSQPNVSYMAAALNITPVEVQLILQRLLDDAVLVPDELFQGLPCWRIDFDRLAALGPEDAP